MPQNRELAFRPMTQSVTTPSEAETPEVSRILAIARALLKSGLTHAGLEVLRAWSLEQHVPNCTCAGICIAHEDACACTEFSDLGGIDLDCYTLQSRLVSLIESRMLP